jgi:hypothetical protein
MILAGQLADDAAVHRFYAEAEAAANLKHPNIVAIHEVGQHDGQHYFSMDYIEGQNLAEWAAGRPALATQAAMLVKTIADAVHYAHQRGTLHRDLKPSNVLIDADDVPHLTDFGLAKTVGSVRNLTQTGDIMGTPAYMAPEQASGRHDQIGPHTDVYALGAILYELLTGQPPFSAHNPMATLLKVMEAEPVAPRTRNSAIPPDLETICLKCLEKAAQRRYHSARDLAEDLDRFLRREPIHARPASMVRKAANWMRRRPGALTAATALLLFGLISSVFYLAEENAFLRARQSNPALTRQPGLRTEALDMWRHAGLVLSAAAFYSIALWRLWRTKKRRADPSDPNRWNPLLGHRLRVAAACLGIATACVSVIILAKSIEAFVWEGGLRFMDAVAAVYFPGWVGLWLLALVVRDYRLANFGRPALTKEQSSAIEREFLELGTVPAIKLYREFLSDASLAEAKAHVDQLESEWRQRDPQQFPAGPLKPQQLNWRLMAITASIEAATLIVLWLAFPAVRPTGIALAEGFALGLILAATPRLKGGTKRFVIGFVVTVLITLFLFGILEYNVGDSPSGSQAPSLLGMFFGAALLTSGYTPRRNRRRQVV